MNRHPVYWNADECPNSEKKSLTTVSIPMHEELNLKDLDYITEKVKAWQYK